MYFSYLETVSESTFMFIALQFSLNMGSLMWVICKIDAYFLSAWYHTKTINDLYSSQTVWTMQHNDE